MLRIPQKLAWMNNFADVESLKKKVIIYPTDTVYGIGCNAESEQLIERVFAAKGRERKKPLSVIAPDKDWIINNCIVSREIIDKYLPGKYTLLVKKKDPGFLALATSGSDTIGVRIPAHRISKLVEEARIPFITTSANRSGEKAPKSLSEVPKELKDAADLIIDGGVLSGVPSTLVDCRTGKDVLIERA